MVWISKDSVQFSSVAQSCPTLFDPMNCSMPGFPVHQQLPESTQTHVHWVADAIQPSHPVFLFFFCIQSSTASGSFLMSYFLASGGQSIGVQLQHQFFQWIFRTVFLYDGLVGSLFSSRDSQESSPTSQFKSINSSAFSLLYGPTLTFIHDYWKTHSLD